MGNKNRKPKGQQHDAGHGRGQQQQAMQPQGLAQNAGYAPYQPQMAAPPGPPPPMMPGSGTHSGWQQNQGAFRGRGRGGGHWGRGGYRGQGNRGGNASQAAARPNPQTPAQQGAPSSRRQPDERAAEAETEAAAIESLRSQVQDYRGHWQEAELEIRRLKAEPVRGQLQAALEGRREAEEELRRLKSECEVHKRNAAHMKDLEAENRRIRLQNADLWDDVRKASWHAAAANEKAEELRSNLDAFQHAQVEKDKASVIIGRWNKGLRETLRSQRDATLEELNCARRGLGDLEAIIATKNEDLHKLEESFGRLKLEHEDTAEKLTSELQAKELLAVSLQAGDESLEKTQAQLIQARADRDRDLDMAIEFLKGLKARESNSMEEDWPMLHEAS